MLALVAIVVVGSALGLGAVHVAVVSLLAPLAFVAFALSKRNELRRNEGRTIVWPAWIALGLGAYTLLQAVPIPFAWLERIAPANADVWGRALLPFGVAAPPFASISMDPGATLVEALKWVSYAALLSAAVSVSRRWGAALGAALMFVSALLVALATVLHGLLAATKIYGFYTPSVALPPWHVGPLINTNTLAGYLNLGALSGAGLLLMHELVVPRWLVALGIAFLVAVDVTSASRGGVLTLIVGIVLVAVLLRLKASHTRESGRDKPNRILFLVAFAVVFGAALAGLGGTSETWSELYDKNLSKLGMLLWAEPLIREHPVLGIGRGAFESVFPAYRLTQGHVVFAYAENFPVQWASEWGLPVTIAALLGFAWTLRPSRLGATRSGLAASMFAGVFVVLLQNLVDLSLEIPAVCYALALVLGSLAGDRARSRPTREAAKRSGSRFVQFVPAIAVILGFVLSGLAFRVGRPDVGAERTLVRRDYDAAKDAASFEVLRHSLRRAMSRHPGEPYFSLVGALSAFQTKSESALPWLQRALERGHVNGRAHLLLAEVLASRGARKQALLELRIAAEQDNVMVGHGGTLALRYTKDFDELLICVPEGERGANMLDELGIQARNAGLEQLRARLDRAAIERSGKVYGPHIREAEALITSLSPGASGPPCEDRPACEKRVEEHAAALASSYPNESIADRLRAKLLLVLGKPEQAEARLTARCSQAKDRGVCLRARVDAAAKLVDGKRLDAASKELLSTECTTSAGCAEAASFLAAVREGRGEAATALSLHERAAREDPTDVRLLRVAEAASRAGAHARAADAFERAAQKRGGDAALRKRAEEERAHALGVKLAP